MDLQQALDTPVKDLTLPDLPYNYEALEPHISSEIMKLHHDKHHAGYLNKLQAGLEGTDEENNNLDMLFSNLSSLSQEATSTVRKHGGGYYNHFLFWNLMSPDGGEEPEGKIKEEIDRYFDSFENFKEKFSNAASGVFGSGWAWLIKTEDDSLSIVKTQNQNNPLMSVAGQTGTPVLGIDVWEHSYYLDYKNERGNYIDAWWNVVNWDYVETLL